MTEKTIAIKIQSRGRFRWNGVVESDCFGYKGAVCTNQMRSPQECLRELADDMDRAAANELLLPFEGDPDLSGIDKADSSTKEEK